VLPADEPADPVPPHPQLHGDLPAEPQRVEPRAHADHPVPAQPLGEDRDAQLDRVGHHHDDLAARPVVGQRVGVGAEDLGVRRGELRPARRGAATAHRRRPSRSDDDDVGDHLGRVERDVEDRCVLVVRVDEVRAQAVHGPSRRTPGPADQLQP